MGARYQSTALRRAPLRKVEACVESWLGRRGFRRREKAPLFAVDPAGERGVYYFSNDGWTIVVYSAADEEKRLVQELSGLDQPLLHVWLVHSDVWGYVLRHGGRTVAEFDSNPDYLHPGSGEAFLDEPEVGDLRHGAPRALRDVLDLDVPEREIAKLQRRSAIFKESAVHAFCTRLGIGPAATSFGDLEDGNLHERGETGWSVTCVRYAKDTDDEDTRVDVHSAAAFASPNAGPSQHRPRWEQGSAAALRLQIPMSLRVLSAAMRVVLLPVYVLGLLLRLLGPVTGMLGRQPTVRAPVRLPGHPLPPTHDGTWLVNETHRCRVTLPPGADAVVPGAQWGTGNVWTVFAVRLDPETTVTCEAWAPGDLRAISPHGTVLEDEICHVSGLKARRRVLELRSGERRLVREVYVIQMPEALYAWELRDIRGDDRRDRFRRLVESFEPYDPRARATLETG